LISDASKKPGKSAVVRNHRVMDLSKKRKTKEAPAELKASLVLHVGFSGAEDAKKALAGM